MKCTQRTSSICAPVQGQAEEPETTFNERLDRLKFLLTTKSSLWADGKCLYAGKPLKERVHSCSKQQCLSLGGLCEGQV